MTRHFVVNEKNIINLSIEQVAEFDMKFDLKFESNDITINRSEIASNPDIDGMASLEEFDPSGEYNPMEMYIYRTDEYLIKIFVPSVELETEYVGLVIDYLTGEKLFDGMLTRKNKKS